MTYNYLKREDFKKKEKTEIQFPYYNVLDNLRIGEDIILQNELNTNYTETKIIFGK